MAKLIIGRAVCINISLDKLNLHVIVSLSKVWWLSNVHHGLQL